MKGLCRPIRLVRSCGAAPGIAWGGPRRCIFTAAMRKAAFGDRSPPPPRPVEDSDLALLAQTELHQLSLADLVKCVLPLRALPQLSNLTNPPRRNGAPPLSEEALLASANFALSLIPVRLANRIQALRSLPYIVVSNPNINRIYNNYLHSLSTLLPWSTARQPAITSLADELRFTSALAELVATHSDTIPILARGFLECRRYISAPDVTRFLDEHLRMRIGTRLIAEQHIALHHSSLPAGDPARDHRRRRDPHGSYIGVIDTTLRPAATIELCAEWVADICELRYGVRPRITLSGETDATFAFVPMHLEYIITELLKNAFRATIENGMTSEPIAVTIAPEPGSTVDPAASSTASHAILPIDDNASGVTIRIRDRGGGISPASLPNIWSYSFTTFSADDELPGSSGADGLAAISSAGAGASSLAGLGYGLPLSRAYAEYFGGGIQLQSLYGWGTDVYLRLKGVGSIAQ